MKIDENPMLILVMTNFILERNPKLDVFECGKGLLLDFHENSLIKNASEIA